MSIAANPGTQLTPAPSSLALVQTLKQLLTPLTCLAAQRAQYGDVFTLKFAGMSSLT